MSETPGSKSAAWLITVAVGLLVILVLLTMGANFWNLARPAPEVEPLPPLPTPDSGDLDGDALLAQAQQAVQAAEQARLDANEALDAANQTTNSLGILLSFLEGAGVLVGLALGATAYFGFRNLDQTNQVLQQKLAELDRHEATLEELDETLTRQRAMRDELQDIVNALFQVHQELSLSNYGEAYQAALRVLDRDPHNPQALYIAGWLELQVVPGMLDSGLDRLRQARQRLDDWPPVLAALGVGLRRKAQQASGETRRNLFTESDGYLRQALGKNHDLLDLNRESFWGPVAGNARDNGRIDEAIQAYEEAIKVTPASSYPLGNVAALYLQKARTDPALQPRALQAFRDALRAAQVELAVSPRDYFNMMDIAMSAMMLGGEDPQQFAYAEQMLDAGIAMDDATDEMLRVSLGGWQRLLEHCPDAWPGVISRLQAAIARVEVAIEARRAMLPGA